MGDSTEPLYEAEDKNVRLCQNGLAAVVVLWSIISGLICVGIGIRDKKVEHFLFAALIFAVLVALIFLGWLVKNDRIGDDRWKYVLLMLALVLTYAGVIANIYVWEGPVILPSSKCGSGEGFYNFHNHSCLTLSNWRMCIDKIGHCAELSYDPSNPLFFSGICRNTCHPKFNIVPEPL